MAQTKLYSDTRRADDNLIDPSSRTKTIPIVLAASAKDLPHLSAAEKQWLTSIDFSFATGDYVLLPDEKGNISRVICGTEGGSEADLSNDNVHPAANFFAGTLATRLPYADYHFDSPAFDETIASQAWAMGAYRFDDCRSEKSPPCARLKPSKAVDLERVRAIVQGTYLGRDLINTPASALGPDELDATAQELAKAHGARVSTIKGDDLLKKNFPMIHAVGRASDRAPRLVDLKWGKKSDPKLTLVGKGIVFDTGGLNLKPGSSMSLMKKDMGGAATALSIASMIMAAKLPVQLRVLLPIAENSISANAYRPGDVLNSRNGMTVEIGNTDAEGRLVLADALSLADEEQPEALFCFATLTGAARVALGPDLPPLYTTTDELGDTILAAGRAVYDPLWSMPFWEPYNQTLHSMVADVSHISNGPFAGSITAALFLKRFVKNTTNFAHIDLYGWVPTPKPGFPKGGEPNSARAVFEWASRKFN